MRSLVTGVAGFIGSQVAERLIAEGDEVVGVDALRDHYPLEMKQRNVRALRDHDGFQLIEADLVDLALDPLLDGVDVVYHLAGRPGVRPSWSDEFPTYVHDNVLATQRILEALRRHDGMRLVYASSSSVYGRAPRYPTTEDDLPRPHSPYGVTKLAGEHLCSLYGENWSVPTAALRFFTVYGPRQRPDMAIHRMIDAAIHGTLFPLFGDGSASRDFTYVDDVVSAVVGAGHTDLRPGIVINVAGGGETTMRDLVALVAACVGRELLVDHLPGQPGDVPRTGGLVTLAEDQLGWRPAVTLEEGVARQVDWQVSEAAEVKLLA